MQDVERRRYYRYEQEVGIKVRDPKGGLCRDARVFDLSLGGIGMELLDPLQAGQRVGFQLDLPGGPLCGTAVVRWARPHQLGWRCGVELQETGYFQRRRLKLFLEPFRFDGFRFADRILWIAATVIVGLVLLDHILIG